jgi:hypothetical protein
MKHCMNKSHPGIKHMIKRFGSEELAQYWYSKNEGEVLNDSEIDEILGIEIQSITESELEILGLTSNEWVSLDKETQDKIKDCNL